MRPGVEGWTDSSSYCFVAKEGDTLKPVPFMLTVDYFSHWILKDKDFDFNQVNIRNFENLFCQSMAMFPDMDTENPDLRNLKNCGGKLILCHGIDDSAIYVDGTIAYYEKIIRLFGSKDSAKEVARLFVIPGDGHCHCAQNGAGPSVATAMAALMRWVENNDAPESIHGQRFDRTTMTGMEEKDTPVY